VTAYPPPPPPPWGPWWYGSRGRSSGVPNPDLRVSDAERSEVADVLTGHFAEGRLDQNELDERLHRTMGAKTRAELAGVLGDLPPVDGPPPVPDVEVRRRRGTFSLLLVTLLIFMAAFSAAAWTWHFPWILFGIIFFVFWRRSRWGWHRHWGWHGYGPGPVPGGGPATWWLARRRGGWWV